MPKLAMGTPEVFAAFKSWFDVQFAAGNIPFGIGATAVFVADARSREPTLPPIVDYVGALASILALIGGLGYLLGLIVSGILTGGMLVPAALVLGALGVQIARKG